MGTRGPVPYSDSDLSRPRERKGGGAEAQDIGTLLPVVIPEAGDWSPPIISLWESVQLSGQVDWLQQSDWAKFWLICDEANEYRRPQPIMVKDPETRRQVPKLDENGEPEFYPTRKLSAMTFTSIMSELSSLGMTLGDRRRMGLELKEEQAEETPAEVIQLRLYEGELDDD